MATPNEQLQKVFLDLQVKFKNNPNIQVFPFDNDPTEKYEVKYRILGLAQDKDGKIIETGNHSVFINIPFGFPHFPPSCTPQSATFHPDFDQAAICIGEFWNKDRTLSELIVHIGKMIAGEVYSRENVFNEAALSWYKKIADQLPFEKLDFSLPLDAGDDDEADNTLLTLSEEELLPVGIDTLEEDDFTSQTDYLNEDEAPLEKEQSPFPATSKATGKSSINRIRLLIRQKRYYELSLFLNDLPDEERFEERDDIEINVATVLKNAQKLQREADELEHLGEPQKALELFQRIERLVPDFPDIQKNIERTKNSVNLGADDWSTDDEATDGSGQEEDEYEPQTVAERKPRAVVKKRVTFFEETTKATIKLLPILGGIIAVALAIVFITPLFTAKSRLKEGNLLFSQCTELIDHGRFNKARIECEAALSALKNISMYKTGERDDLQKRINLTLASEEMVHGLSGHVLFQGRYVPKADMERILDFDRLKEEADTLFDKSLWKDAADKYVTVLKTSEPILNSIEESRLQEISVKIHVAEIHLSIDRGFSLLSRGELGKSQEMFASALLEAETLPEELGGDLISRIKPKLNEIKYLEHLNLGKKYFDGNDWESAVLQYEKALKLRDISSFAKDLGDAGSLYANMAEAELFSFINSAKDAFSQSNWNAAIEQYQAAIRLLDAKKNLLQRINPDEIKQQLERIIVRARIVQYKQMADIELEKKQYRKATSFLEQVITAVTSGGLQDDDEFKAIIKGTEQTIVETQEKAAIAQRIGYLEKSYKEIFEANYSAAIPEYLSDPKATFLRYIGKMELYEIQCLERNRGRQLRLVMLYSYDPAEKTWQFYSESN